MSEQAVAAFHAQLRLVFPGISDEDLPRFAHALSRPGPHALGADAQPCEGVPRGSLTEMRFGKGGGAYPGVERVVRVYSPAERAKAASLMVFQDGARYLGPEVNAVTVLDNLIAAGEIPPLVGVFVEPGETGPGLPIYGGAGNRSVEYDSIGAVYANFLVEELLPEATRGLDIAADARSRAICGLSSGGICAFNAAWERPDYFSKVVSHCGSFVDIRGGHALAPAVRRAPPKPLRVFLQTGEHDLNIVFGAWTLANRTLADALAYRGYDHRFVVGEGGHSLAHGGSIFPDTLRWLWRE